MVMKQSHHLAQAYYILAVTNRTWKAEKGARVVLRTAFLKFGTYLGTILYGFGSRV